MCDAQMEPEWLQYLRTTRPDLFHEWLEQMKREDRAPSPEAERLRGLVRELTAVLEEINISDDCRITDSGLRGRIRRTIDRAEAELGQPQEAQEKKHADLCLATAYGLRCTCGADEPQGAQTARLYTAAEVREAQAWIPCSERQPDEEGRYAVIYQQRGIVRPFIGDWIPGIGWTALMGDCVITHWTPLPPAPAAEKGGA